MSIVFKFRDFFHPRTIWNLHRTLQRSQWLPQEELYAYRDQRLRTIISHSARNVPYYQRLFQSLGMHPEEIRTQADLAHLPLLQKRDLREQGHEFLATNAKRFQPRRYQTSGTTGEPLQFYLDRGSNSLEFVYYWRHWSWAGYRLGDRFAELGSHFFLTRRNLHQKAGHWRPLIRCLLLNSSQISTVRAAEMAELIRKRRPLFLKGTASALYFLAFSFREAGIDDIHFKAIFSTGEVLTPLYRSMIEDVFSCVVLDSYGHMERTAGISQCPRGSYHVNIDYGALELVDRHELDNQERFTAKTVGTSLYNFAMPLIRYDIGDRIEGFKRPPVCPCGRTLPVVAAIHGRNEDVIVTPDGRYVTSMFIVPELVEGMQFVQFVQSSERHLEVLYVPIDPEGHRQEEELENYVRKLSGEAMELRLRSVLPEDLVRDRSGKIRAVISYSSNSSSIAAKTD